MRSRLIPSRSHKTETLGEVEQTIGKRAGRRRRNGCPAAAQLSERVLKGRKGRLFGVRFRGFAHQQIAEGRIGDPEQVAVAPVREHRTRPSARLASHLCPNDPATLPRIWDHPLRFSLNTIF